MAENYLSAAFKVPVTEAEASLLQECVELADRLEAGFPEEIDKSAYEAMSDAFRATFPPSPEEEDPFASFFGLFDDPDFPNFDCSIIISEVETGDGMEAYFGGDQMDVHAVASLIQEVCKSALPFAFEWATHCSKLRAGEFGGGFFVVTDTEIHGGSTGWLMEEELQKLKEKANG